MKIFSLGKVLALPQDNRELYRLRRASAKTAIKPKKSKKTVLTGLTLFDQTPPDYVTRRFNESPLWTAEKPKESDLR